MRIEKTPYLVLAVLVAFFLTASISSLVRKSPVSDESAHHLPPGYVCLKHGDFVFATDSPPLARMLGAGPMLLMDIDMPENRDFWARDDRAEFSRTFLYSLNRGKFFSILYAGRLMIVLLAVFGGIYLFRWTARNLGPRTALIASGIYFLSPNITAHARFVTTDLAATVFIMCSVLSFWELFRDPGRKNALFAALFLSLALLSKYSALLLVPVFLSMAVYSSFPPKGRAAQGGNPAGNMLLFFTMAFVLLWAGYCFETKPMLEGVLRPEAKEAFFRSVIQKVPVLDARDPSFLLYGIPVPLRSFLLGVVGVLKHGGEGASTFFMGKWSTAGHPMYYLAAILIKTPVPTLLLLLAGLAIMPLDKKTRSLSAYLGGVTLLFVATASRSNLQLGLRYILPVYPFIFIICAVAADRCFSSGKKVKAAAAVALLWLLAVNIRIWPDYLSYFNYFGGGPENGYNYLRDSNIDWGQDLPALKGYMDSEGIGTINLSYWGEGDPSLYGIIFKIPSDDELVSPANEVYAISVNNLEAFGWTASKVPDARAGYSINIYDLRENR